MQAKLLLQPAGKGLELKLMYLLNLAICNEYKGNDKTLYHFDMYRIDGWDDFVFNRLLIIWKQKPISQLNGARIFLAHCLMMRLSLIYQKFPITKGNSKSVKGRNEVMLLLSVDSSAVTASAALTEDSRVIKSEFINKGAYA